MFSLCSNSIYCRYAPIRYEINPSFAQQTYRVRQHISNAIGVYRKSREGFISMRDTPLRASRYWVGFVFCLWSFSVLNLCKFLEFARFAQDSLWFKEFLAQNRVRKSPPRNQRKGHRKMSFFRWLQWSAPAEHEKLSRASPYEASLWLMERFVCASLHGVSNLLQDAALYRRKPMLHIRKANASLKKFHDSGAKW